MMQTPDQFAAAQRAAMELAQQMGAKMQEGATKLMDLNLRTMQAVMSDAPAKMQAAFTPGAATANPVAAFQPDMQKLSAYAQQAASIMSSTSIEIAALMQKVMVDQGAQMAKVGSASAAQFGAEQFTEAATKGFAAMQETMQQALGAATPQIVKAA